VNNSLYLSEVNNEYPRFSSAQQECPIAKAVVRLAALGIETGLSAVMPPAAFPVVALLPRLPVAFREAFRALDSVDQFCFGHCRRTDSQLTGFVSDFFHAH